MRNSIFYFTGTGNSLKIAKDLQTRIGSTDLHTIPRGEAKIEGDVVGFVFPIYFARAPVIVQEFIERAEVGRVDYLFLVANGGGLFGTALKRLAVLLRKRSLTARAGFLISMPGNHPKVASLQRRAHESYFRHQVERTDRIATMVVQRAWQTLETNLGPIGPIISTIGFTGPYRRSLQHRLDEDFRVTERCIGCGTCESVCPVGNISRASSTGQPRWNHRCANCAACYHHCPQEAIEMTGISKQMKRYRHPEITLAELMA